MKITFEEEQKVAWSTLPTDITIEYSRSYFKNSFQAADVLEAFLKIVELGDEGDISTIMRMLEGETLKNAIIRVSKGILEAGRVIKEPYRGKLRRFYMIQLSQGDPDKCEEDEDEIFDASQDGLDVLHDDSDDEFFDALQDAPEDEFFDALLADSEEEVKEGDIVLPMSGKRTLGVRIVGYALTETEDVKTAKFYMNDNSIMKYDPKVGMLDILENFVVRALDITRNDRSEQFNIAEISSYILRMQTINPSKAQNVALSLNQLLLNPTDISKLSELVINLRSSFTPGTGITASWARLMGRSEKDGDQLADEIQQSINYLSSEETQHSCS